MTNVLRLADPMMKSPVMQRAREQFRSISIDNKMEPNDFFGGGINESSLLDDCCEEGACERSSRNYSFAADTSTNQHHLYRCMSSDNVGGYVGGDDDSEELFDPIMNSAQPGFVTRMRMYLKPHDGSISLQFLLLVSDTILALIYICAQLSYVLKGSYDDEQDKLVQLLIAFGVTGAVFCYCFADGARFLRTWPDRLLYFLSCLLQKPILLPILLPGSFFQSYVATKQFGG